MLECPRRVSQNALAPGRKKKHVSFGGPVELRGRATRLPKMLQRFLLLWLVASSLVALYWTRGFPEGPDPLRDVTRYQLYALIAITMFAIGLMLPRDEVQQVFRRWPTVLAGTVLQYTSMPLLAVLAVSIWGFSGTDLVGVVMVGCVPGAMASNVLTLNARGNISYSVSLTTSATIVSPIAVPIAIGLSLRSSEKVTPDMLLWSSVLLLIAVVIPVAAGHLLGRRVPSWESGFRRYGSLVANLAILLIIAVVVAKNRQRLTVFRWDLVSALLAINILGYIAGYCGAAVMGLPESMRRALTLEVGMQNAGLGTTLALSLFGESAAIAPAMYTFGCMLTGTIVARIWAAVTDRQPIAATAKGGNLATQQRELPLNDPSAQRPDRG